MNNHSPNHQNQKSTPFLNWKVPQSRAYMIGGGVILATIVGIIMFGQHDKHRSVPPTVGKAVEEVEEVKRLVAEKTVERSRRH
eukprot:scaffold9485_cov248-Ochromonas_danica.AAC.3